jgi:hypothetical protein
VTPKGGSRQAERAQQRTQNLVEERRPDDSATFTLFLYDHTEVRPVFFIS